MERTKMKFALISALIVAVAAATAYAGAGCPGVEGCFVSHTSPGCNDASCCTAVCIADSFCCSTQWDGICVDEAAAMCAKACPGHCEGDLTDDAVIDGADLGMLLANWAKAGCGDLNIDGAVDGADLGVMLGAWGLCPPECGLPIAGDCCTAHDEPFCSDASCCNMVCGVDVFCCDVLWAEHCAEMARELCEGCPDCGNPFTGDCCTPHSAPFCNDESCCNSVCTVDSYCCDVMWDAICVDRAQEICPSCPACGNNDAGDCCAAHDGPFCNDETCCSMVCSVDSFCCQGTWDSYCAEAAADFCSGCPACGNDFAGSCFVQHDTPFCNDEACCAWVCAIDSFCCNNQWDSYCVETALVQCAAN
jgi:hypothetical protein